MAGITLHVIDNWHGINSHHIVEAAFKAVARRVARWPLETDPRKADADPVDQRVRSEPMLTVLIDYDSGQPSLG